MIGFYAAGAMGQGDAPTLWTPANIATQLWLDAADSGTVSLDVNDGVIQWGDKSGNGRHAAQATAPARPTLDPAARNGLDIIRFDGVNDVLLFATSFPQLSGQNVWLAGDTTGMNSGNDRIFLERNYTSNQPALYLTRLSGSFNAHIWWGSYAGGVSTGSYRPAIWRWRIRTSPSDRLVQVDGGAPNVVTAASTNLSSWSSINTSSVQQSKFAAYEIIVTGNVDDSTREKIEGYLAWKWGMVANLPSGHPYKSAPPTV